MGFAFSFGFFADYVSSFDFASSTIQVQWLASVFTGIIFCVIVRESIPLWLLYLIGFGLNNNLSLSLYSCGYLRPEKVYRLTAVLSSLLFVGYGKLSRLEKIEWNNRGFSTFHALFASFTSFYLLMLSDIFYNDSQEELVVNRSSTFSNSVLGISIGYFLADLAMILWHFSALGGLEYVLHHGLSLFSIIQSLLSGQGQIYILMVLFSESTTPFVNMRWHLDIAGLKNSKLYIWNGIALFFGWLVARIFLFIFFFIHMWIHFDEVKEIYPLGFYSLLTVPPVLAMMNVFWFWKIAKGMVKTLSKAKHSK